MLFGFCNNCTCIGDLAFGSQLPWILQNPERSVGNYVGGVTLVGINRGGGVGALVFAPVCW